MDAAVCVGADEFLLLSCSCSWSQEFLKAGGYSALLTRLNELLEVEWQYDCVIVATCSC